MAHATGECARTRDVLWQTYRRDCFQQGSIIKLLDHPCHELCVELRLYLLHFLHLNGQGKSIPRAWRHEHVVRKQLHRYSRTEDGRAVGEQSGFSAACALCVCRRRRASRSFPTAPKVKLVSFGRERGWARAKEDHRRVMHHPRRVPLLLLLVAPCTLAGFAAPPLSPAKGVKRSAEKTLEHIHAQRQRHIEKAKQRTQQENDKRRQRRKGLAAALVLASQGCYALGALAIALPTRVWRLLPGQLPKVWRVPRGAVTTDTWGQAAFMLSNVAYLYAGVQLLLSLPHAPHYGALTLAVCAASVSYHTAQVIHGCDSEASARTCTVDTVLAVLTGLLFVRTVQIDAINLALAALSLSFFTDHWRLGYTVSHSLWHCTTAAAAVWSGGSLAAQRVAEPDSRWSLGLLRKRRSRSA